MKFQTEKVVFLNKEFKLIRLELKEKINQIKLLIDEEIERYITTNYFNKYYKRLNGWSSTIIGLELALEKDIDDFFVIFALTMKEYKPDIEKLKNCFIGVQNERRTRAIILWSDFMLLCKKPFKKTIR